MRALLYYSLFFIVLIMLGTVTAHAISADTAMMRERQSQPTPVYEGRVLSYTHHVRPVRSAYYRQPNRPSRIKFNTYNSPRVIRSSRVPLVNAIPDYVPMEERLQIAVNNGGPLYAPEPAMPKPIPASQQLQPLPPQIPFAPEQRSTWDVLGNALGVSDYDDSPQPMPDPARYSHLQIHNQVDRNANYVHPSSVPPGVLPAPQRPPVFFANDLVPHY